MRINNHSLSNDLLDARRGRLTFSREF